MTPKPKRSKYGAKKTKVDGVTFDSKAESARYAVLRLLERAGKIKCLMLQPEFILQDKFRRNGKGIRAIAYVADFQYLDEKGRLIVEDVKGVATETYLVKLKLFLFKYGQTLTFREIRNGKAVES